MQSLEEWSDALQSSMLAMPHLLQRTAWKLTELVQETQSQAVTLAASSVQQLELSVEDALTVARAREISEGSTQALQRAMLVGHEVDSVFASGAEEVFEDGMESAFSRGLVDLVVNYGDEAVAAIGDRVSGGALKPEVAGEALSWLGRVDPSVAREKRLYVLEHCLAAHSAYVVDGALLGLAAMDEPGAIPYLRLAAQQQRNPDLRHDLEQVICQLEETRDAAPAETRQEA